MKLSYKTSLRKGDYGFQIALKRKTLLLLVSISLAVFGCQEKQTENPQEVQKKRASMHHRMDMDMKGDASEKTSVAILVYPGVELLDFSGPAEVFSNTRGFEVFTVSSEGKEISTKNNTLHLTADYALENAPQPDILVLPGAPIGVVDEVGNKKVTEWIKRINEKTILNMSVCTGALLLSKSGLLNGKTATSHLGAIDTLRKINPKINYVDNARFVEDGKMVTTAGVSAGIDGALHVVDRLKGRKAALFVTAIMEYDYWNPKDGLVIGGEKRAHPIEKTNILTETAPSVETSDVVCGMPVPIGNSKYRTPYKGREYRFCSPSCQKLFEEHTELYVLE